MTRRKLLITLGLLPVLCAGRAPAKPAPAQPADAPQAIHLEAENGTLTGVTVQTAHTGFSGTGYVGDFAAAGAHLAWTIPNVHAGLYNVQIRFRTPSGTKGYELVVNGHKSSGMFPASDAFTEAPAGKVELQEGANTVGIERGWGYFEIDALDLTPAPAAPPIAPVPGIPSDPQATPQARALLRSLTQSYGSKTLSGQSNWADSQYVHETTGQWPAILGMDLMDYSPSRLANGSKPGNAVEDTMQETQQTGQIITVHWHWNAPMHLTDTKENPWWSGFYTKATTFDVAAALDHPESPEYQHILSDMDTIAVQLQKYQAAGVPVLWRPLHEAEGGWFWWGAKGPEAYKKLWRLMYTRLTKTHKLHNLIWVYSSGTDPKWYPGDDVVDVVGVDEYPKDPSDALTTVWDKLLNQYGGRKSLALTEFGGVPDVTKMQQFGVRWAYFMTWNGREKMPAADLTRLYTAPGIVNAGKAKQ
ncbi:MAG: beta-mannanase [Armatimonadota bacterium]|nr:beta-mannanase [Armatimonadota bacterium]